MNAAASVATPRPAPGTTTSASIAALTPGVSRSTLSAAARSRPASCSRPAASPPAATQALNTQASPAKSLASRAATSWTTSCTAPAGPVAASTPTGEAAISAPVPDRATLVCAIAGSIRKPGVLRCSQSTVRDASRHARKIAISSPVRRRNQPALPALADHAALVHPHTEIGKRGTPWRFRTPVPLRPGSSRHQ